MKLGYFKVSEINENHVIFSGYYKMEKMMVKKENISGKLEVGKMGYVFLDLDSGLKADIEAAEIC